MHAEIVTAERNEKELYLPRDIPILSNNEEAFRAVEKSRWPMGKYCPRCKSLYTKAVNTSVFRELHRCLDCGYMFNTFSGTMFQGSKLPVVKFFQLFVVCDAVGKDVAARDVSYAISVSNKTAVALITRVRRYRSQEHFTVSDRNVFEAVRASRARTMGQPSSHTNAIKDHENFFSYCDMKSVVINLYAFRNYLSSVLSTTEEA